MSAKYHPRLFDHAVPDLVRVSRAWLRNADAETRNAFATLGLGYANRAAFNKGAKSLWHIGGRARAKTAQRDTKGRFLKEEIADATNQ